LFLLENFANQTPPPKAIEGQLWYDSRLKKLRFYDGLRFKFTTGAEPGAIGPTGLTIGEFWWDTAKKQLKVWDGSEYTLVGPEASPDRGQTLMVGALLKDDEPTPNTHSVIEAVVDGKVISIYSNDEFTIGLEDTITGFTDLKKGTTLIGTPGSGEGEGVSYPIDPAGVPGNENNYINWGTSSDSLRFGGKFPESFLTSLDPQFNGNVHFPDGYSFGGTDLSNAYMHVFPTISDNVVFENKSGQAGKTTFRMRLSFTEHRDVAEVDQYGFNPGEDATFDLGKPGLQWKTIYAENIEVDNITGNINGDTCGTHTGNILAYTVDSLAPCGKAPAGIIVNGLDNVVGKITNVSENYTQFYGVFNGALLGNAASASNADKLANYEPYIFIPTTPNKESAVIRDSDGKIYGTEFVGVSSNALKLKIDDSATDPGWNPADETTLYRGAKTTKTSWSIAARDSLGNLSANIFNGTATAAQFADLAEKYLTDKEYAVGTVIVVGGEAEVTASSAGDRAIGVISKNPAYMMNCDLEGGTYIALKGRTPVQVIGTVKKGQQLVADNNGCASVGIHNGFAVALESSSDDGVKLIEAVIL